MGAPVARGRGGTSVRHVVRGAGRRADERSRREHRSEPEEWVSPFERGAERGRPLGQGCRTPGCADRPQRREDGGWHEHLHPGARTGTGSNDELAQRPLAHPERPRRLSSAAAVQGRPHEGVALTGRELGDGGQGRTGTRGVLDRF